MLLDGDGEAEDIDDVLDELGLDQAAELGDGTPLDLFFLPLRSLSTLLVTASTESTASLGLGRSCSSRCLLSHMI